MFQTRKYQEELMDHPDTPRAEFEEALKDIRWVNRNLGGTRTLLDEVVAMIGEKPGKTIHILDLGTGSADIPIALAMWGREKNINLKITALDLHPVAVESATQLTSAYPEISVVQGDALHTDYPEASFDIVTSSMFMHHLGDAEAIRLLQEMERISRIGFVVNDLERHPLAWLGISILGTATFKGRLFRNDAPLSVLRGFTRKEALQMVRQAGLKHSRVLIRPPHRLVITGTKRHEAS